ncbi:hypothetical protein ABEV74_11665 [Paenibacillus cisolokensis]|jgi:hypothetical protein|uniref:Uncharacterized protein n=1 Tax=Paenibacillus cisolokensis TaxID=1658519 RepID=A0ABQ4NF59_9BACL|nr:MULTISPECIES: hypothetical protein [Paenibacillus]ALS26523.1 hypothetical protein IJ21_11140 [Paenibacillus sp. 32O-W]GIQ66835.1 hypothetical protein PACILC2_54030 [Paenibacillus cisolokensis]
MIRYHAGDIDGERSCARTAGQAGRRHMSVDQARNGSMVQDLQDMKRLGHDMKRIKTNSELKAEGMIPDPIQE